MVFGRLGNVRYYAAHHRRAALRNCRSQACQLVLGVVASSGNAVLVAARHFCEVLSTNYIPTLLERGRARAEEAEGLQVAFQEGATETYPSLKCSCDVLSITGVMFASDKRRQWASFSISAGNIGFISWTPDSFTGDLFRTIVNNIPPPPGPKPPFL